MFIKNNTITNKIVNLSWRVFNKLENNGGGEFHENGEMFFLDKLFNYYHNTSSKNIVLFDVGANIGEYTKYLIEFSNKYNIKSDMHLFEPTKDCFKDLNIKYSNMDNVLLNNIGLSNKSIDTQIFYDEEKSGLASLCKRNLKHFDINLSKNETINLIKAVDYINDNYIKHIDFMKIDIEGYELTAFKGFEKYMNNKFIDVIQFEYGGANIDSKTSLMDYFDYFTTKEFILFKVMKNGLQERIYSPYMENFMNSNYCAISKYVVNKIKNSEVMV